MFDENTAGIVEIKKTINSHVLLTYFLLKTIRRSIFTMSIENKLSGLKIQYFVDENTLSFLWVSTDYEMFLACV